MKTTNARVSMPHSASHWRARLEKLLTPFYPQERAAVEARLPDTRHLENRQVLRLNAASNISQLHVRQGTVWLTCSPADGDVILKAGERLELGHGWPVVVQALRDSRVELWH